MGPDLLDQTTALKKNNTDWSKRRANATFVLNAHIIIIVWQIM